MLDTEMLTINIGRQIDDVGAVGAVSMCFEGFHLFGEISESGDNVIGNLT